MKTNIIVVDLDKTLIYIDSLRWMACRLFWRYPLWISWLVGMRLTRFISACKFNQQINEYLKLLPDSTLNDWVDLLWKNYQNKAVLQLIDQYKTKDTTIILCSASPQIYVKKIAEHIGFTGFGSHYDESGIYKRLFGQVKYQLISEKYPQRQIDYKMSVSDCLSDKALLDQFEYKFLIDPLHGFYIKPL